MLKRLLNRLDRIKTPAMPVNENTTHPPGGSTEFSVRFSATLLSTKAIRQAMRDGAVHEVFDVAFVHRVVKLFKQAVKAGVSSASSQDPFACHPPVPIHPRSANAGERHMTELAAQQV